MGNNARRHIVIKIMMFIVLLTPVPVLARDPWTKGDTYREITAFTLRTVDWKTTRNIARNPDEYIEANPLLGEHPSLGRVNTYFIITSAIHPVISYYLPRDYRTAFQYLSIGVSGTASVVNLWSGLEIKF